LTIKGGNNGRQFIPEVAVHGVNSVGTIQADFHAMLFIDTYIKRFEVREIIYVHHSLALTLGLPFYTAI
jgi:hypothetical protein